MIEQVAEIVAAYVGHNNISPDQLPTLISTVSQAVSGLGQQPAATPEPAVPIRRSVGKDAITCVECGWSGQMLKRHLATHGMTPEQYRARWNLAGVIRWSPKTMRAVDPNLPSPSV